MTRWMWFVSGDWGKEHPKIASERVHVCKFIWLADSYVHVYTYLFGMCIRITGVRTKINWFPVSFQLYYINSALGLYFPYDFCLFGEMDAVLSYSLRYIPAIVTSSVCVTLLIVYKLVTIDLKLKKLFLLFPL